MLATSAPPSYFYREPQHQPAPQFVLAENWVGHARPTASMAHAILCSECSATEIADAAGAVDAADSSSCPARDKIAL